MAIGRSTEDGNRALDTVGDILVGGLQEKLSTPGRGKLYGDHHASAPGDPPAVDDGGLRSSVAYERDTKRVGVNKDYAAPLEFGTGTIEPRPFMEPTAREVAETLNLDVVVHTQPGER
jgi:hypothetical protein